MISDNFYERLTKSSIAIVDDESDLLFIYKAALMSNGFKVDAFEDSSVAVNVIKEHHEKYFLIMTDIRMPKINGFQLVNEIKKVDPSIRIIMMSAFCISESDILANLSNDIKIDQLITKPIALKKLIDIVETISKKENI